MAEDSVLEETKEFVRQYGFGGDHLGYSPLHRACLNPNGLKAVKWLIEQQPSLVHAQTDCGCTPLHLACTLDITKYLVEVGKADAFIETRAGTPFIYTIGRSQHKMNKFDIADYLFVECDTEESVLKEFKERVKKYGLDGDNCGYTRLHSAASKRKGLKAVKWLIEQRPSMVHAQTDWGGTPLHQAATVDIAKYLVEVGKADLFVQTLFEKKRPYEYLRDTPCAYDRSKVADYLLSVEQRSKF